VRFATLRFARWNLYLKYEMSKIDIKLSFGTKALALSITLTEDCILIANMYLMFMTLSIKYWGLK